MIRPLSAAELELLADSIPARPLQKHRVRGLVRQVLRKAPCRVLLV